MSADATIAAAPQPKPKDVQTRWGGRPEMLARGFVGVPILFLESAAALRPYQLNPAEVLFVISLMAHKWDERAPFPGYKRIAKWMGKTESYARKLARDLQTKGLLKRIERTGYTNEFDLTPLFAAILSHSPVQNQSAPNPKASRSGKKTVRKTRATKPVAGTRKAS